MNTSPSYEKINYSVRPSKATERRMILEFLSRLSSFEPISTYGYIGFGSTYFVDFKLFHRYLGLSNLTSLEKDVINEDRFNFNKPFSCIDIKFTDSSEFLNHHNWNEKVIIWLDYDKKLDDNKLEDIQKFCANAPSGSVLLLSVNISTDEFTNSQLAKRIKLDPNFDEIVGLKNLRLDKLKKRITKYWLWPDEVDEDRINLGIKQNLEVNYKIITNQIKTVLNDRNVMNKDFSFANLFNFKYNDGAPMFTFGGILLNQKDSVRFNDIQLADLGFIRDSEDFFEIPNPSLTFKEVEYLNSILPTIIKPDGSLKLDKHPTYSIPPADIEKYSKIYRYFPHFSELLP